jgi:hypothetical protein
MIHRRSHKENDSSKSKNAKDKSQREEQGGSNAHIEDTQRLMSKLKYSKSCIAFGDEKNK